MQTSISCNFCGKEMDFYDIQNDFSIHKKIGYGSMHDGEILALHLCCECMDRIINICKQSPLEEQKEVIV